MIKGEKRRKITVITDLILGCLFMAVLSVSFLPVNSIATSGGEKVSAIYSGNKNVNNVSIMINVYENTEVVNKMIGVFNEKKVKATFFVGGCWADDNGETLCRLVNEGFEIGNHGYFHKDHKKLSYDLNLREIKNCGEVVKGLCGETMKLFAPPSGSYSNDTLLSATNLNYKVIMWSKDTIDWRDSDTSILYKRATKNPKNGDLILMHPKEHTLEILPSVIDFYLKKGFNIVTVGENIENNV